VVWIAQQDVPVNTPKQDVPVNTRKQNVPANTLGERGSMPTRFLSERVLTMIHANQIARKARKRRYRSPMAKKEAAAAYLYLIPAFLGLAFITYLPLAGVFGISLFNWDALSAPVFNAGKNFINLFTKDPYFIDSIKVTIYFSVIAVAGSLVYSLAIAMLLNRKIPVRGFWRAVYYVPYVLPAAAVYMGWSFLYETNFGLFNYILSQLGIHKIMFLTDSKAILPSLALISVWLSGNLIVIFLAGLQNVPRVYNEAAEIDGANAWHRFIHVTLPCMSPIILYNILMSLVINMQIVVPALTLTNGGPGNASMFMTFLMYRYAFMSNNLGYACAISFVFFILIGVFTLILFATSKMWTFYEGGDDR
jgi:multiple sugar transport system permease protein